MPLGTMGCPDSSGFWDELDELERGPISYGFPWPLLPAQFRQFRNGLLGSMCGYLEADGLLASQKID